MASTGPATWNAVLEAALDCIIVMDASGKVREFNPAAQRTFGYTRAQTVGRTLSSLIVPPELRVAHESGLRKYLATGEGPVLGRRIEIEGVRSDGARIPVELAIVPFEQDGERLFAGYLRDLTERRRAAALAELLHTIPLAASQAATLDDALQTCLRAVCGFTRWPVGHAFRRDGDAMVSAGLWHGPEAVYAPFRATTEGLRFARGEGLPGRIWATAAPAWIADLSDDLNFPRVEAARRGGLGAAFGLPVLVDGQVELVLEFFAHERQVPDADLLRVLDLVGRELGRVVARVRVSEELVQANARLKEVADARRRFLSQAAHELGTPLTSLALQMRLVQRLAEGKALQARLDIMQRNLDRLGSLSRDLLDAARAEMDRLVLRPQPMDLAAVARASVAALEELARGKHLAVHADLEPTPLSGDPQRLGQVVDNLLANAIRFTPEGGNIGVRCRLVGNRAVLDVEDDGHGIDPDAIPRLFQPFSQVHGGAVEGGTGLGLFITRGIVAAHGGTVTAHSPGLGLGATLRVELPTSPGGAA